MAHADRSPLAGQWTIDPRHSHLGFKVRHAMVTTVRGSFRTFDSAVTIDPETPHLSSVALDIDVASISTGVPDRDAHLVSADFFDAATHPLIRFVSREVARDGDDWQITGDLTIRDTTRSVSVEFEHAGIATDGHGFERAGFEGGTTISRKDWGLTYNAALETGGVVISDKVTLVFDLSVLRAP